MEKDTTRSKKKRHNVINAPQTFISTVCENDFGQRVFEVRGPVLAVFWAPWSEPCLVLLSVLEDLAKVTQKTFPIVKINADDNLLLSLIYNISSIPTLICFNEGIEKDRIIGTASKEAILAKFKSFLNSSIDIRDFSKKVIDR